MSSKSKTKTSDKGGFIVTRPLSFRHMDALYAVINQTAPQLLLPQEKDAQGKNTGAILPGAVGRFNELRKLVDEQRVMSVDGQCVTSPESGFDGEQEISPAEWRKMHDLSEHYFPRNELIVFQISSYVKGVLRHFLCRMPNVLPMGVHLAHWEAIIVAFRLTNWQKAYFADKALADPDGESTDFDEVEENVDEFIEMEG